MVTAFLFGRSLTVARAEPPVDFEASIESWIAQITSITIDVIRPTGLLRPEPKGLDSLPEKFAQDAKAFIVSRTK